MDAKNVVDQIAGIIPYKLCYHYRDLKYIKDHDLYELDKDDALIIEHFILDEDVEVFNSLGIYTMKQLAKRYENKSLSRLIVSNHLMTKIEVKLKELRLIGRSGKSSDFSTFEEYLLTTFNCSDYSKETFSVNRVTRYYGVAIGDANCSIVITHHLSENRFSVRTELKEYDTEFGDYVTIKEVSNLEETRALKALKNMLEH